MKCTPPKKNRVNIAAYLAAEAIIIIIIMYIYYTLINALSTHMTHINLNTVSCTHVEHSPTKTIYISYCMETHIHARTHRNSVQNHSYWWWHCEFQRQLGVKQVWQQLENPTAWNLYSCWVNWVKLTFSLCAQRKRHHQIHRTSFFLAGIPWKTNFLARTSTPSCWNGRQATRWPWGLLSRGPPQWSVSWVTRAVWTTSRLGARALWSPCRPSTSLSCLASGPGPSSWPASLTDRHH